MRFFNRGVCCRYMAKLPILILPILFYFVSAVAVSNAASEQKDNQPTQHEQLQEMKNKGVDTSLTILPVRLGGRPFDRVSEVIGLLLEQKGLKTIELVKTTDFNSQGLTEQENKAEAVGGYIQKNPILTDYALYAEFNGSPAAGLEELYAALVDKTGAAVWIERKSTRDEEFKKYGTPNPMSLSMFLAERVGKQLGLTEETAKAARPGKMARLMNERSGIPPQEETVPLEGRQKEFKKTISTGLLVVFPARVNGRTIDKESASELASMIQKAGICKASPAEQSAEWKQPAPDPNEMKRLWDFAREVRDYSRINSFDADYVIYTDYGFNPQNWTRGFVHFVICDRKGEWVFVDMRNSHHMEYKEVKPVSRGDCDKIVVKCLESFSR